MLASRDSLFELLASRFKLDAGPVRTPDARSAVGIRCVEDQVHVVKALLITLCLAFAGFAQAKTEVPAPEPGAKAVTVDRIEGTFARGAHEMIAVLPDSKTVHNGSMYSSSVCMAARAGAKCQ